MRNLSQNLSSDRYEWISAYVDNELDPAERKIVEHWLDTDPKSQASYQKLLLMRQVFQGLQHQDRTTLETAPTLPSSQIMARIPQTTGFGKPKIWVLAMGGLSLACLWMLVVRPSGRTPAYVQHGPLEAISIALATPEAKAPQSQPRDGEFQTAASNPTVSPQPDQPETNRLTFALDQPILALPSDPETSSPDTPLTSNF